jgi:ribose/xylose/arabinose/galactoside ABC-type transport system permease subunit
LFFGLYHGLDMHYDWKNELHFDGLEEEMCWYDEGFISEVSQFLNSCAIISILCLFLYMQPEVITYELFTWGDIGMSTDVRFFGVAPHWYFRPFMSWLIICPFYYLGLLGLLLFFISFYFQPNIVSFSELYHYSGYSSLISFFFPRFSNKHRRFVFISRKDGKSGLLNIWMFGLFCASLWYVFSYLPYGRFFNSIGGNNASLIAYLYIYFYMCGGFFRSSFFSFNLPL